MRKLRAFYTEEQIAGIYGHTYDHTQWPEHVARVRRTIDVAQKLINEHGLESVTDLSAGDGAIVNGLTGTVWRTNDISENGDGIEVLVKTAAPVDLWICTETIEHLEAPWTVLEEIARRTRWLVLSTPLDEDPSIGNYEHYWSFTLADVADLLAQSGFVDAQATELDGDGWTYTYQLWIARSTYEVVA